MHQPDLSLRKTFTFEAAHRLPNVPEGHKCGRLHGHSFKAEVCVKGPIDPKAGWVIDLGEIAAIIKPIEKRLDHHYLNEIPGLENPTCENLAVWILRELKSSHLPIYSITVHETCTASCTVYAN